MITKEKPNSWQELEQFVAVTLRKCGMRVERQKNIPMARGSVDVDVYAVGEHHNRTSIVLCECKHWEAAIPKTIVHSFATVISDSGANQGYIISKNGFQVGAIEAAEFRNLKLFTWEEFQKEFAEEYYQNYFRPKVEEIIDQLVTYTEELNAERVLQSTSVTEENKLKYSELREQYYLLSHLCLMTYPCMIEPLYKKILLPLLENYPGIVGKIPQSLVYTETYEDFLSELEVVAKNAQAGFDELGIDSECFR